MKKILFLSLFAVSLSMAASAQLPVLPLISTTNGTAKDTVANTGVKQLVLSYKASAVTIGIQVDIVKLTGTLGGTLIPVASNDGVTYYPAGSGTLTVTDVTNQGILFTPPLGFAYYGVRWTGTGTMSGTVIAKIFGR